MSDISAAPYSGLDRLLHRLAFANLEVQKSLADIEDRMHAKQVGSIAIDRPVFITALPRAGTTLILDILARNAEFATHTYRCMPFVLCPMLWDSLSRGFRRPGEKKERMHGDGMSVSFDSPEAFEEVLWKAFWPKKYRADCIEMWSADDRSSEFEEFFRSHIRKLIALNRPASSNGRRYISKNNANMARIALLKKIFPDAIFITPFRDPLNQAVSLLRQHQRFMKIHAEDRFARRYMDDIGHFEFGGGLRPISFPATDRFDQPADPMRGDFWLAYWIRGYGFLAGQDCGAPFIDFDRLCAAPRQSLATLSRQLAVADSFESSASEFHSAVSYDAARIGFDPLLVERARAVHAELSSRALNSSGFARATADSTASVTKLSRAHITDS